MSSLEKLITWCRAIGKRHVREPDLLQEFITRCRAMDKPHILELGTNRSIAFRSTKHEAWIPNAGEFVGSDIEAGIDVDIVADVHRLSEIVGPGRFDVVISCSTFEHFKYPHLAAHQILKTLKMGGLLFVQTHQTFPLHAYPFDYFRFSQEALAGLFGTNMGFRVMATDYEFPARIFSIREPSTKWVKAFLNVRLWGDKTGNTPDEYIYELDH